MAVPINRYQNMVNVPSGTMQTQMQNPQLVDNAGAGLKQIGQAVGNYASVKAQEQISREEANQSLWLSSRQAQDKMAAKRILETAKQTAQAGGKIKPSVDSEWTKYVTKQREAVKSTPYLAELYESQLADIKNAVDLDADDWEVTEQTRYTGQIFQETIDSKLLAYDELPSITKINAQNQKDLLELNALLDATALDPAEKQALRDKLKKDMPNAVMELAISRDPYFAREAINAKGGFETAVASVFREEGKDFVPDDGGAGPTMLGINSEANPDVDVKNLSPEKAKTLYKERYWDAINGDSLPPDIAHVGMDIAVVQGQPTAVRLIKEAGGDLEKLIELRNERFKQTAQNPEKAKFLNGWLDRSERIAQEAGAIGGISAYKMGTLEQRMDWREKADREISAREAEAKRQVSLGRSYIDSIESRLSDGFDIPEQEMQAISQQISASNNPELNQLWQEAQTKSAMQRGLSRLNPREQQDYIANVLMPAANQDGATRMEAAKLEIAQKTLQNTVKLAESDPLALYEKRGASIPPVDFKDGKSFNARAAFALEASRDYEVPFQNAFFRPNEKAAIETYLKTQPVEKQVQLMDNMVAQLGSNAAAVSSVFEKSTPGFSYAVSMLSADPTKRNVAASIIEGKALLAMDKSLAPKNAQVDLIMQEWQGYIYSPAQYSAAKDAAVAIYAARNGANTFDDGIMREAIQDAIGGAKASINGQNTITPVGVSADQFEAWVQTVSPERITELMQFMPQYLDEKGLPKAPFNFREDRLRLRAIGANRYQLYNAADKPLAGKSSDDGAAIITVTKEDIQKDSSSIAQRTSEIQRRNQQNSGAIMMRAGF